MTQHKPSISVILDGYFKLLQIFFFLKVECYIRITEDNRDKDTLTCFTVGLGEIEILTVTNKLANGEQTTASLTGIKFFRLPNKPDRRLKGPTNRLGSTL